MARRVKTSGVYVPPCVSFCKIQDELHLSPQRDESAANREIMGHVFDVFTWPVEVQIVLTQGQRDTQTETNQREQIAESALSNFGPFRAKLHQLKTPFVLG